MLAVVAPVFVAGAVVYLAAALSFATSHPSTETLVGTLLLLAATTLAERYPVPVDGVDASGVSVGFVFGVAAIALFGWDAGVLVFATPQAVIQLWERRPPIRIAFNAGVFAVAAATGGLLVAPIGSGSPGGIAARVLIAAFVQYCVNMVLVSGVIAANGGRPFFPLVRSNVRGTILPFTLMASASLILAVLWQRTPFLTAALAGPLIAIALYQRSMHKVLRAMRLALTDPLTGLGNHRHFHDRLSAELALASEGRTPLALCFLDVDDFKQINDSHGHPTGDRVLSQVAARLRQDGEAFRLGGDEFAIVLAGSDEGEAERIASRLASRVAALELDNVGPITVSAGIATFPEHAHELDELIRLADGALYRAKEHGKNRVHVSRAPVIALAGLKRPAGASALERTASSY
jgi:diguanylate cyclase (GGDEF)-like protein